MSSATMAIFPRMMPGFVPDLLYSQNATLLQHITPKAVEPPFYHTSNPSFLSLMSDKWLSLAVPIVFYWAYSLVFFAIDSLQSPYFEKRRIHESPETLARNKTTIAEVVRAVMLQHAIMVVLGMTVLEDEPVFTEHLKAMTRLAPKVGTSVLLTLGPKQGQRLLLNHGRALVQWTYWWGIPAAQFFFACFVMDTWQYFWHRAFHTSRFLYRHVHSIHHRLYCPYAFGALYNHPIEGLVLDTCGSVVAQFCSMMSLRQAAFLFGFSTLKTIDDHCGYRLWWDPLQAFFPNNADYHDIHHQAYGIKANYSQPYFTNWDKLLGTLMTRDEANKKTRRFRGAEPVKTE